MKIKVTSEPVTPENGITYESTLNRSGVYKIEGGDPKLGLLVVYGNVRLHVTENETWFDSFNLLPSGDLSKLSFRPVNEKVTITFEP